MNINMKAKIFLTLIAFTSLFLSSCDLDINEDPNNPSKAENSYLLSTGITYSASVLGSDAQLIGGFWSQHYTQNTTSNQYKDIDSYNVPYSQYNRIWNNLWAGALKDLSILRKQSSEQEAWDFYAAGTILTAFNMHFLVDMYGTIPFDAALSGETIAEPVFVDGATVNNNLLSILDDAIAKIALVEGSSLGSFDLMFSGDLDNWRKFAKTLKLKILMRDFIANQTAILALLQENDLLDTDAKLAVFDNVPKGSNPLFENDRRELNTGVNIKASKTFISFLQAHDDPRISNLFEVNDTGAYVGIEQGNYEQTPTLPSGGTSLAKLSPYDPVFFLSEAASYFLQAEAYARLSDPIKAKIFYDRGVTASFERIYNDKDGKVGANEFSGDKAYDATTFLAPGGDYEYNASASIEGQVEQIITQKWVAAARAHAWDSFFDQNRTGYPRISDLDYEDAGYVPGQYVQSYNAVLNLGEFPRRLLLPKSSSDFNQNTPEALPIIEKMWWHK